MGSPQTPHDRSMTAPPTLAQGEEPAVCFELASELQALPPLPDWEQLMAKGVVPALVLGAERRLRR